VSLSTLRPDLAALAQELARHLPGWTCEPRDSEWFASLRRDDGPSISIHNNRGRLSIHGAWPKGADGHHYYPHDRSAEITCAVARPPASIARDIERRLLPVYLPLWQEQDRKRREAEESSRQAEALIRRLEDVLGIEPRDHGRNGRRDSMTVYFGRAEFTVYRYGSFKFEFRGSAPDELLSIAGLMKTFGPEE